MFTHNCPYCCLSDKIKVKDFRKKTDKSKRYLRVKGVFMLKVILSSGIAIFLASCSSSKFEGSSSTKKPVPKEQPAVVATPAPTPEPCNDTGTTVAKLLTNSISNNAANQVIRYELSISDCVGGTKTIQANVVMFDTDSMVALASVRDIPYTVESQNHVQIASGMLLRVDGSDLFGKTGSNYYYNRTSENLPIPPNSKSIFLNIDFSNTEHNRLENAESATRPAQQSIDTYLKFGDAAPVTQPVTFLN